MRHPTPDHVRDPRPVARRPVPACPPPGPLRGARGLWLALLGLAVAGALDGADAQVLERQLLVADVEARPGDEFPDAGALFLQSTTGDSSVVFLAEPPLTNPYAVDVDAEGRVLVIDRGYDVPGVGGLGALFRIDPFDRVIELTVGDDRFQALSDVDVLPDGRIVVVDREANPLGLSQPDTGALFAIDPETGEVSVLASPPELIDPVGIEVDSLGTVFVIDQNADPFAYGQDTGAIFELDPDTGSVVRVVSAVLDYVNPVDAVRVGGHLYLIDQNAFVRDRFSGDLFEVDIATGDADSFLEFIPYFRGLADIIYLGGSFYMLDKDIDFGEGDNRGGIYIIDPATRRQSRFASSAMWGEPRSLVFLPTARVEIAAHDLVDLDGGPLNPGDEVEIRLASSSLVSIGSGYTVRDSLAPWLELDPSSFEVGSGSAIVEEGDSLTVVVWTDAVAPGEGSEIRFRATVQSGVRMRQPMESVAVLTDEGGGSFRSVRTDTAYRALLPTEIVFSDPVNFFEPGRIAVARGDGSEVEILNDPPDSLETGGILNPTGITVDIAGDVYFVDPSTSIPPDTEGRGACFRYRPLTGETEVFTTDANWRDPSAVAGAPNGDLVVLDSGTAPDGNSGAVYRLDPTTGEILSMVTDERWQGVNRVAVTAANEILVLDRLSTAGGYGGGRKGAVYRIDEAGTVTLDLTAFQFENLGAITTLGLDRYFLADNARKRIYLGGGGEPLEEFLLAPSLGSVQSMTLSRTGELLVLDGQNGAVYRVDLDLRDLDPLAQSDLLQAPTALATLPASRFEGSQWVVYDVNGEALVPGDRIVAILQIRNTGTVSDPDTEIIGRIPDLVDVDEDSFTASDGELLYDPATRTMTWRGPLPLGELVNLTYASTVSAGAGMGSRITNDAEVLPAAGVPFNLLDTQVVRGPLVAGDVLVVDPGLPGQGSGSGGVLRRDYPTGAIDVLAVGSPFVRPVAVGADLLRHPLVLDGDADPLGLGTDTGALFRYDPSLDEVSVAAASALLRNPVDIEVAPDGTVYILDADADPDGSGTPGGAVFALPPGGGSLSVVGEDSRFREPVGIVLEDDGSLYLLDRDAFPVGGVGAFGVLFRVVPGTGVVTPLMTGEGWREVSAVARHPDGGILIADRAADPDSLLGGQGAVFRVDPFDLSMTRYLVDDDLLEPVDVGVNAAGEVVVLDVGDGSEPPRLWGVNELSGTVRNFWAPEGLVAPTGIGFLSGPDLTASHFVVTDPSGAPVVPGDRLDYVILLENAADIDAGPVEVTVPIPEAGTLVGGSVDAGAGSYSFDGAAIRFAVSVVGGGTAEVSFSLDLGSELLPGTPVGVVASVDAGNGVTFALLDQQRIPHELDAGDLIVLDRLAPPEEPERGSGTLFLRKGESGDVRPISSLTVFSRLEAAVVDPLDPDATYLVDSSAGTIEQGRDTGAVFEIGTRDGRLRREYRSELFAGPVSLFFDDAGDPIVVDFSADPGGTGVPRGALFRLDRTTGDVTLDVTHPSFSIPRHGTARGDGTYLVVDRAADPTGLGGNVGTVFRVNPATGVVSVAKTGGLLVDPVWIVPYSGSSYVIVDETSDPDGLGGDTGALLEYFPGTGLLRRLGTSPDIIAPVGAKVGVQGEIYLADRGVDPDAGPGRGAILRYHPGDGLVTRYAVSDRFRAPLTVDFVDAPTPVRSITVTGRSTGEGVVLDWDVVWTGTLSRADVYRAPAGLDLTHPRPGDLLTPDGLDPRERRFVDPAVALGEEHLYWVGLTEPDGTSTLSGSVRLRVTAGAPRAYALSVPRPNPFASRTAVAFDVPAPGGPVRIEVLDLTGRRVRVLDTSARAPGRHRLVWDGRTDAGHAVAPGVYFVRLSAGDVHDTRRVVRVR